MRFLSSAESTLERKSRSDGINAKTNLRQMTIWLKIQIMSFFRHVLITFMIFNQLEPFQCTLSCPHDWYQVRDNCFMFNRHDIENFVDAERECRILYGGNLATIKDHETQTQLFNTFHKLYSNSYDMVWIGMAPILCKNGSQTQLIHKWLDNSALEYSNWESPIQAFCEQVEHYDDERRRTMCTAMSTVKDGSITVGKWIPNECGNEHPFICEMKAKETKDFVPNLPERTVIEFKTVSINPFVVSLFVLLLAFIVTVVKYVNLPESFCRIT